MERFTQITKLYLEVLIINLHSFHDEVMDKRSHLLGIRMSLARSLMETKVEDVLPLIQVIGVSHHRVGIEHKDASCILRW